MRRYCSFKANYLHSGEIQLLLRHGDYQQFKAGSEVTPNYTLHAKIKQTTLHAFDTRFKIANYSNPSLRISTATPTSNSLSIYMSIRPRYIASTVLSWKWLYVSQFQCNTCNTPPPPSISTVFYQHFSLFHSFCQRT